MAIFRPGSIVGAISGNLGTLNFVAGKGTPIVRKRIRKKDSQTPKQITQRSGTQTISSLWRKIPADTRLKWNTAAKKFPHKNRLGQTSQPSGFQLFFTCAMGTWLWNRATGAPVPPAPETIALRTLTFSASASGNIRIAFNPTIFAVHLARIYASRPFSTVIPKHFPNLKHMTTSTGDVGDFVDITSEFDAAFGHPAEGEAVLATVSLFTPGWPPQASVTLSTITVA